MPTLTREQVSKYASDAGFTGDNNKIAVAVALAESGGKTTSHNGVPPDDSYGLMQVNMIGSLGPARRKAYGLKSNTDLYDPATNMRVAYGIYKGSGWKAWTTYTSGKYKLFLNASDTDTPETVSAASPASSNPILGVGDAINAFGATIFKAFANFSGIAVAIALVILGIVILLRDAIPVVKTAKTVSKIAGKVGGE
jgi:Lysozyme like domain